MSPLRFAAQPGVPTYADGRPRPLAPELIAAEFPSGDECLNELRSVGVPFQIVSDKRGVSTPIAIEGPIGGVRYWTVGSGPMVSDCRLALALAKVAPELRAWDHGQCASREPIVPYGTGRRSPACLRLGADVHEVVPMVALRRDARLRAGLPNGCVLGAPLLNRLALPLVSCGCFRSS